MAPQGVAGHVKGLTPQGVIALTTAEPTFATRPTNTRPPRLPRKHFFSDLANCREILSGPDLPLCMAPGFEAEDVLHPGQPADETPAGWCHPRVIAILFQLVDDARDMPCSTVVARTPRVQGRCYSG